MSIIWSYKAPAHKKGGPSSPVTPHKYLVGVVRHLIRAFQALWIYDVFLQAFSVDTKRHAGGRHRNLSPLSPYSLALLLYMTTAPRAPHFKQDGLLPRRRGPGCGTTVFGVNPPHGLISDDCGECQPAYYLFI